MGSQSVSLALAFPQVSVDIFKGFPDEESIVNYTLNQAYQDNVTVFASMGPPSSTRVLGPTVGALGLLGRTGLTVAKGEEFPEVAF